MAMVGSPQVQDVQHLLRRLEFPLSAKEALNCLGLFILFQFLGNVFLIECFHFGLCLTEQLCLPLAHARPPTSKQLDYIGEIIDEFVFCEIDRKGTKRKVSIYHKYCIYIHN